MNDEADSRPRARSHFLPTWWVRAPLVLLLLAMLARPAWEWLLNDPSAANYLVALFGVVALLVYVLWFLVGSGLRVRTRWLLVFLFVVVPISSFFLCFEITGLDGSAWPRFAWRWRALRPAVAHAPDAGLVVRMNPTADTDFPQFLGPARNGVVPDIGLATDWREDRPARLWRQPIGEGWSGFATSQGWVVTMAQHGAEEHTLCMELTTGRLAWRHTEHARHETKSGGIGPRSTPAIRDGLVYSLGATGILCCLDGRDGRLLWRVALYDLVGLDQGAAEKLVAWGRACSPLLVDGMVVVGGGGPKDAPVSLIAFDARTGAERWRGGSDQIGYASPCVGSLGGRRQVVSVNEKSISGHDLKDGHTLWSHGFPGSSRGSATVSQPVLVDEGHVFTSKGYGVGSRLLAVVPEADDAWTCTVVWRERRRLRTKFSNPVLVEGRLYGLNEGRLECIEARSGAQVWSGDRYGHGQCLAVGPSLLVLGEDGVVALVDRRTGEERGRFPAIEGKTWSSPALAGDLLVVRNSQEAACYRLPRRD